MTRTSRRIGSCMIVDLHGHYAMHLAEELHPNPLRALRSAPSPASDALVRKLRASLTAEEQIRYDRHRRTRRHRVILRSLFSWINATFNYRSTASGPGVTLELMKKGGVGVVLSPLLDPFNEFGSLPGWMQLEAEYAVTTPVPVLATHIACRFGTSEYNLSAATITEIGKRNGLMGVIFCDHWMHDGPSKHDPRGERETFEMVKKNIDWIASIINTIKKPTESPHKCTAIGSDLDGFIKPMLRGLEDMAGMSYLENWLRTEYRAAADLILSDNALRVLKSAWRRPNC